MNVRTNPYFKYVLFAAFSLSGFSGLIYESVWTNYLKFFLGHAAYAQSLVLAMFMGGMAAGAWICERHTSRLPNPLLAYAAVELIIGVFGLVFHKVFLAASAFIFSDALPGIASPLAVELLRWGFAAILILPQTLLLGATFPLMSLGILRAFPNTPGSSMSMLYFTNSIGAVVGVLVSGFVLIGLVGLPGTILTAGLINVLLALIVYRIGKEVAITAPTSDAAVAATPIALRPLLMVAMITGLSSFIYEISWIRMLTMVIGASTHAFELMLSAFILGLALGGLWLRKRIDNYKNPLVTLGIIQLLMGLFALCTVLGYNPILSFMNALFRALQHNEFGYLMYNASGHFIAMALMLPTTFMAGMTLPLITLVLFKNGGGEAAIGKVYAFNTLGAIIGVVLAAMLLLPLAGLKMAIIVGAGLDLALALYLLTRGSAPRRWQLGAWSMVAAALAGTYLSAAFNTALMASGVFRADGAADPNMLKVVMHRDGRTATVDVYNAGSTTLVLATNGKPDASMRNAKDGLPSMDEPTQIMLGGIPLLINPHAQTAAMIGIGAGMSANVLLMSEQLKQLDIVEIEGAMVDGARQFGTASARVFNDPRSHIHIDDAKSYFAAHKKRFDVIVSEPSDTWVSGVSTLFTDEFYGRMRNHLTAEGVLVQWVATYGSTPDIVASIMQAISHNFADYRIYAATNNVMVIVAKVSGKVPELDRRSLDTAPLRDAFARIGLSTIEDIHSHEIGRKEFLDPVFLQSGAPVNSDFFPFVDQHALKARFLGLGFNDMTTLHLAGIPLPGVNFDGNMSVSENGRSRTYSPRTNSQAGRAMAKYLGEGANGPMPATIPSSFTTLAVLRNKPGCDDPTGNAGWQTELLKLAASTMAGTNAAEAKPMIDFLRAQLCDSPTTKSNRDLVALMAALAERDMPATELLAARIVGNEKVNARATGFALDALLLAYYQQKKWEETREVLRRTPGERSLFADIVASHAVGALKRK